MVFARGVGEGGVGGFVRGRKEGRGVARKRVEAERGSDGPSPTTVVKDSRAEDEHEDQKQKRKALVHN